MIMSKYSFIGTRAMATILAGLLAALVGTATLADSNGDNWRGFCLQERFHFGCVTEYSDALAAAEQHRDLIGHEVAVEKCN